MRVSVCAGMHIQGGAHSSVEDAQAVMLLYKKFEAEWEDALKTQQRTTKTAAAATVTADAAAAAAVVATSKKVKLTAADGKTTTAAAAAAVTASARTATTGLGGSSSVALGMGLALATEAAADAADADLMGGAKKQKAHRKHTKDERREEKRKQVNADMVRAMNMAAFRSCDI